MDFLIIIGAVLILGVTIILRMWFESWIFMRNAKVVVGVFREHGATDQVKARPLEEMGLQRHTWFRLGLRNYRAEAVRNLVGKGVVQKTVDGRYFLSSQGLRDFTWLEEQ